VIRALLVLALGGLMQAARSFTPATAHASAAATTLGCGYLLLSAFLVGDVFKRCGLPRLTGYLATGVVVGPQVLDLLSASMVEDLGAVNGMAIALIALSAGVELELRAMRPLARTIGWISLIAVGGTVFVLADTAWLARGLLPFLAALHGWSAGAVALVLGVTMVAQSPAVVVALRDELGADGPVVRTALGVVVIADLLVVLLFAVTSTIAQAALGARADALETVRHLAWEILGSGVAGVVIGAILAVYLARVRSGGAMFVAAVAFVVGEIARRVHFDPLLVALAAGLFVRNATDEGERLLARIHAGGLPVYVSFFALTGARIHLDALRVVGPGALVFVLARAAGLLGGSRLATRIAGAPALVVRYAGFGLLPQAGLALALASLFARTFPGFGEMASALTFSVVALNELLAPVLFRAALLRSGEAGTRVAPVEEKEPEPAAPRPLALRELTS
jgi:Kef-type K+ transport system membrane component KefB